MKLFSRGVEKKEAHVGNLFVCVCGGGGGGARGRGARLKFSHAIIPIII